MNKDSSEYKIISTHKCIEYIENSGLTIHDDSEYRIKSTSGLVYILPNGEVVLIPTNFDSEYPGIIFKDLETFECYKALDFFPIGKDDMTWPEKYYHQMKNFRTHSEFYSKILKDLLYFNYPFKCPADIQAAFLTIQSIIHSSQPKELNSEHVHLISSFGLGVINYMIDFKGFKLILKHGHENYNPVIDVLIEKNGKLKDIINTSLIFLKDYNSNSLKGFMESIGLR